jgi:hypothetical protein
MLLAFDLQSLSYLGIGAPLAPVPISPFLLLSAMRCAGWLTPNGFVQVFILKAVEVFCFATDLEVFILLEL